jgi:hypothetical protein
MINNARRIGLLQILRQQLLHFELSYRNDVPPGDVRLVWSARVKSEKAFLPFGFVCAQHYSRDQLNLLGKSK